MQELISIKVENGTLFITTDSNNDEAKSKKIRVKLPSLTALETTSGWSVSTKNTFRGTDIDLKTISGSEADLSLEYDAVKYGSTSGSKFIINRKALKLNTNSSSGSSIDYHGSPKTVTKEDSSGGSISKE